MSAPQAGPSVRVDDLSSEFDFGTNSECTSDAASLPDTSHVIRKRHSVDNSFRVPEPVTKLRRPHKNTFVDEASKAEFQRSRLLQLDAYSRHKELINQYMLYYPGATKLLQRDTSRDRTDIDVIRENHRFVWRPEDGTETWEKKLSKRYYDKLFKEYAICDLSRYKENKIAMRWRIEKEVIDGKGHFTCGNKKCKNKHDLTSWEVNFAYSEKGQRFNELVKLRLCPDCSDMLNYREKRKKAAKKCKGAPKEKSSRESTVEPDIDINKLAETSDAEKSAKLAEQAEKDSGMWAKPVQQEEEKSREQEFDEFLDELFV